MKERVAYLLKYYLVTIALFVVAKLVFMLLCGEGLSLGDYAAVVWHGLSLDLSTALYFFAVPFLLTIISLWVRVPRFVYLIYNALVALVLALIFVADASLYPFWHFKLDASCLLYLETPTEAMASVTTGYLVLRFVLLIVIVALIYLAFAWVNHGDRLPDSNKNHEPVPMIHRVLGTLGGLLLIGPIIIGIRGGIGESTTNIGQVYFSKNQFLNHAAVNPAFSFLSSIEDLGIYVLAYDYMPDAECRQLTDGLYYTDSTDADTLLTTQRPNIVFIVMESCGGQFTKIGGHPEITPRLNQLAGQGVYFSECYANSWRTDKGMVSIFSGYPAFPVTSIMKLPEKSRNMPSIAYSLGQAGYQNTFYYGGDINFTNMRSYVLGTGYDRLVWKADYTSAEQSSCQWGVRDDIMFNTLLADIQKEQTDKPWMKTLLTLSSHEPWDVPTKVLDDEVYNAFNYLDQCIGRFLDDLQKTPAWQNTLVVILPDHGYRYQGIDEATRLYNHIPMIWVGGAVRQPVVIDRLCNQSDLAATLLGQLGIRHDEFRFSRDITSSSYRQPMAYHNSTSCISVYDSTGWVAYDLDANSVITQEGDNSDRLLRLSKAILQLTSHDLKEK